MTSDGGTILDYAPELLPQVRDGVLALDAALTQAKARREAKDVERAAEQKRCDQRASLPTDLGVLVDSEQLTLKDALRRAALPASYADRVASGLLSVDEAEHLLTHDTRIAERAAAIQRYVDKLHMFIHSIGTALLISGGDANREDVLATMNEDDRREFLNVERHTRLRDLPSDLAITLAGE